MAQWVAAVPQPYLSAPAPDMFFDRTYQVGNGSLRLLINKIRQGYSDVLTMIVTDSVAEKGGARGYAKFNLAVTKPYNGETGWFLTSNLGGNFSSKGMFSRQVAPHVHELLFYCDRDKLRGCFSLIKSKDVLSPSGWTLSRAQLLFGFNRRGEAVHAVAVTIASNGISLAANIEEPNFAPRDQLQHAQLAFSHMKSNVIDGDNLEEDEGESRKENGHGWDVMGQIKNGGSASGIGNGSVWNVNIQK